MALFRTGSLPLAVETGRYSRPPIPLAQRLCKYCDLNEIETEKHFLMTCPLYTDLRYNLTIECAKHIDNFNSMNTDDQFVNIMKCDEAQQVLCKSINKFFLRRKLFCFY